MPDGNYRYLNIHHISEFLNVSPSLLRKYETIGLISPKRDKDNQYRVYGPDELSTLLEIRQYRKLGIPINEIKLLLGNDDAGKNTDLLKQYQMKLKQRISQEQLLDYYLEHEIKMRGNEPGILGYMQLPDQIYELYPNEMNQVFDKNIQNRMHWMINENPNTYFAFLFPECPMSQIKEVQPDVIICSPDFLETKSGFMRLPGGEYAFLTITEGVDSLAAHIYTAEKRIRKDGKRIHGRILAEMNTGSDVFTLYIPVKKTDDSA